MDEAISTVICTCGARKVDLVFTPHLRPAQYQRHQVTFCPHCDRVMHAAPPARGTCPSCDRLHKHTR